MTIIVIMIVIMIHPLVPSECPGETRLLLDGPPWQSLNLSALDCPNVGRDHRGEMSYDPHSSRPNATPLGEQTQPFGLASDNNRILSLQFTNIAERSRTSQYQSVQTIIITHNIINNHIHQ